MAGRIGENFQVMAGLSLYKKDDNNKTVRLAKLSASYAPKGKPWSIGGNIDNSSKSYGQWGMSQDARTLVAAFGKYQLTPKVDIALNLHNLLDEKYYANAIDSGYGNQYWGEPLSWTISLNARW